MKAEVSATNKFSYRFRFFTREGENRNVHLSELLAHQDDIERDEPDIESRNLYQALWCL